MTHGSLFSGIGGFDLASEWMGWENKFHCEWNEFGQKVLKHYWPKSESYGDITKTDFTIWNGRIDILTGGFPCQPYSQAGKRLGKEDERHLWPEMLRAIREIQPRWVVGENVFGLVNWNDGMVFDEVQADLEAEGYEVQPYVLPAVAVNAPHRRDRIWFVAHAKSNGGSRTPGGASVEVGRPDGRETQQPIKRGKIRTTSNPNNTRNPALRSGHNPNGAEACEEREQPQLEHNGFGDTGITSNARLLGQAEQKQQTARIIKRGEWHGFPTQSPVCGGDDGLPTQLDGITFPKWRNESIKAYGNAIVPQVAHQIFKSIDCWELQK
jgi:DNA (cytosine-5)-methyltransferase 1